MHGSEKVNTQSKAKAKGKKKPKKTSEEIIQEAHRKLIAGSFKNAGFVSVPAASEKNFTFRGSTTDFDDVFVFENVIVLCEYTVSKLEDVSTHLKKKKLVYDKIQEYQVEFIEFFSEKFPGFAQAIGTKYSVHQRRIVMVYCSLRGVKTATKQEVDVVKYFDYNVAHYFSVVSKSIRKSSRFEIFDFLGLRSKDVAQGVLTASESTSTYPGSILPESHSNFGKDFKVVSFYVDPKTLLERSYVLRKYGWRAGGSVYQRMISTKKISDVRKYLREKKRVFINNIIVTLPNDTKLLDPDGDTINPKELQDTQPGRIQIPDRFNTIGIIDGQHRVFSYHEGGPFDEDISILREQQNLLVTGIVYPKDMLGTDRLKFEAKLFLEINANQTNARSDLKQEISLVINPFAPESIAKRVVNSMNENNGPLVDQFERYFFEKEKLKTTSVVSFAIKPLTSPQSKQSLFALWDHPEKNKIFEEDASILEAYVQFCVGEINKIFSAFKKKLPDGRWTADRKKPGDFLTTTNVNGVTSCLREIVGAGKLYSFDEYTSLLGDVKEFKFEAFRSSQYNRMGKRLFADFFDK